MKTINQFVEGFFKDENQNLLENYPGITLEILKREFFEFAGDNYLSKNEFYLSPKWWGIRHPNSIFFNKLKNGTPLQYISKKSFFYRYLFSTSSEVFIPRSETESLVEMGIAELKNFPKNPKVLDCGTGTGIIIIALGEIPFDGFAFDLNPYAISLAKKNYFNLRFNFPPSNSVHFLNKDFFEKDLSKYHLIISNPPYIKKIEDNESVHRQVKSHEPELALFIDDSNYDLWFERFLNNAYLKIEKNGVLLMEGHENHLNKIGEQARLVGFEDIMIIKDLTGRDRFLRARKNG